MLSPRRLSRLILAAAVSASLPSLVSAQTVYVGPVDGDWGTAANWSTGIVPTTATDVVVDNRAGNFNVLTNNAARNTRDLTVNGGDSVTLNNAITLTIAGNLMTTGNGNVRADAAGSPVIQFSSATATISGTGGIDFNRQAAGANAILRGPGSGTLTNTALIRGSGTLDNIRFTNGIGGVLENYQTVGEMVLDANNGGAGLFVNLGTIRALAGSRITFVGDFGGDYNSTGGAIQANGAGAIVSLRSGASITGGNYSTTATGEIQVQANQTASMSPQSLSGILRVNNGSHLNVGGTMNNNGSIRLTTAGSASQITLNAPWTLNGTGTLIGEYSGAGPGPQINAVSHLLTLGTNQTVSGTVNFDNSRVLNNGLIDATTAAGIRIDSTNQVANGFVNAGTMRSSGGGLMVFVGDFGGEVLNNGTISAVGAGSITEIVSGVTVTGGTWSNSGGGVIRVRPNHTASLVGPTIPAGSTFTVGSVDNLSASLNASGTYTVGGTLDLNAGANVDGPAPVMTLTGATTLTGGGRILGTYDGTNFGARIDPIAHQLTIAAGNRVEGVVHINNARVENNGLIDANVPSSTFGMYVDPSNQGVDSVPLFFNKATMRASNGGLMQITGDFGGQLDNTGGTLSAIDTNSVIELVNNATVLNGTWTTSGGGVVRVRPNHTGNVVSPTIPAGSTFTVGSVGNLSASLNASGTYTVGGTLELNAGANVDGPVPLFNLTGPVTLTDGGRILGTYDGTNFGPRIDPIAHQLTIAAGNRVEGVVYLNNARVVNNGLIDANVPSSTFGVLVDPSNQGSGDPLFFNKSTMRASNGGLMQVTGDFGGSLDNTGGTLSAVNTNSVIELVNNATVLNGTWTTSGGGVARVRPNHTGNVVSPTIPAGSTFTVQAAENLGALLNASGTYTVGGTLDLNANANVDGPAPIMQIVAPVTLAGTGRLLGTYDGTHAGARIDAVAHPLTISSGFTVEGVVFFSNSRVTNDGLINATAFGDIGIDPSNQGGGTSLFVNNGTIRASGGNVVVYGDFGGSPLTGPGNFIADAGRAIRTVNAASVEAGPISGEGTFRAESSSNAGFLKYTVANLQAASSGTARIIAGGGNGGTSKVKAIFTETNGRIDVTDHAIVVDYDGASPAATIRGYLATGRNGGNWNGAGIMSSLATLANRKAVGYAEASEMSGPNVFLGQSFDPTSVLIRYTINGDATLDGQVQFSDLVKLAQNYETAGPVSWARGDFNYDNAINFGDLVVLAQNYNTSLLLDPTSLDTVTSVGGHSFAADFALAQSMVPEPASLTLLTAAASLIGRRRR